MTIKLVGSSSGSVALDAPASTTSGADLTFKLPVADGSNGQALTTNASGQLAFTTIDTGNGSIKAWGYFTGTDTGSITTAGSGNVASISDEGTGHFKVTYTTAIGSANYAVVSSTQDSDGTGRNDGDMTIHAHNTAYTEIKFFSQQGHTNAGRDVRDPDGFSFIAVA